MSRGRQTYISEYTYHNKVTLIRGGAEYFKKLEEVIDTAQYTIHFQVYILDDDETGNRVAKALIRAANRGVQVYLLLDGYASQRLSHRFTDELKKAGINFSFFRPLFKGRYFFIGRRMHHKVIVIDAARAFVGGLNISDRYNDTMHNSAWLDWAIYSEGEVAERLDVLCSSMWKRVVLKLDYKPEYIPIYKDDIKNDCIVRVRRNDWVRGRTDITQSYMDMFAKASEHITILTSYFWPSRRFLRKMAKASRKGVKIRLILAGRSDVPIAKYAERYMYRWLFRNKVDIYEYQENVLHGKLATFDDKWATIGSYNVNNISAYASIELNLEVKNAPFAIELGEKLDEIVKNDCIKVTELTYNNDYHWFQRLVHAVSYQIVHLIFFMFTFYFKHGSYDT